MHTWKFVFVGNYYMYLIMTGKKIRSIDFNDCPLF